MTRGEAGLIVLLSAVFALPARASCATDEAAASEEPPASDTPETVRVEGVGDREPTDLTGAVTIIHAADFASRITSLPRLLDEVAGLRVRAYGGLGAYATVSIRGSTAEQVNIYLDGVLLNPALGGGVNLADLSLASIDTIEIYRGFTPSFLTTGSIGGAIYIRTKKAAAPTGDSDVRVSQTGAVSYGSYQTAEASGTISFTGARLDGLISGELTRGDGDFRFFDNNGTTLDGSDDRYTTRINNDFERADLLSRMGSVLEDDARLDFEAGFTTRNQGVPGIDALQSEDARARGTRALIKADYSDDSFLVEKLRLNLALSHTRTTQEFEDRSGDTTGGVQTDSKVVLDATTFSALYRWHRSSGAGSANHVTVLESVTRETAALTDRLDAEPGTDRSMRTGVAFSVEDEIHLTGSRLIVSPSVRWEHFSNRFDGATGTDDSYLTARLGTAWRARKELVIRAGAGRFIRQPSFLEIFGDQGAVKGGGPELQPEEGINYDIGMTWDPVASGLLDSFHLETTCFSRQADELIQFILTSQSQVVARNTGRARVTGAELATSLSLFGWFEGGLDYTWQVAEDRSDTFARSNDLPGRPRHELSARAAAKTRWGRPFYTFDYVGPNYFDSASAAAAGSGINRDLYRVPGRYIHGAGFTRAAGRRAEVTVQVDNIFDVLTVDVARYPLPGRVVSAKLRMSLP